MTKYQSPPIRKGERERKKEGTYKSHLFYQVRETIRDFYFSLYLYQRRELFEGAILPLSLIIGQLVIGYVARKIGTHDVLYDSSVLRSVSFIGTPV